MITVAILINGQPIYTRTAVNITLLENQGEKKVNIYRLDDLSIIKHVPFDGAVELARKMLNTIYEVKMGVL
ncbi:MAG: hypothetical protein ABIG95_03905 [Candidatus Woesearchaeota archaeon]